ncbi:hypothetical protein FVA95_27780 [Pseudonocardia sp. EV170527-09]|nr:hypothetical protein FVA95_27780 [Pseudonocardia sp. EV170527-09]
MEKQPRRAHCCWSGRSSPRPRGWSPAHPRPRRTGRVVPAPAGGGPPGRGERTQGALGVVHRPSWSRRPSGRGQRTGRGPWS